MPVIKTKANSLIMFMELIWMFLQLFLTQHKNDTVYIVAYTHLKNISIPLVSMW